MELCLLPQALAARALASQGREQPSFNPFPTPRGGRHGRARAGRLAH